MPATKPQPPNGGLTADGIPTVGEITSDVPPDDRAYPKTADEPQPEPKVESTDTPEVDFTAFLNAKGDTVEEKKPEAEVEPKTEEQPKVEIVPKPAAPKQPAARDYSDLDPDVAPLFKQMSNEAFSKLKPLLLEHKLSKAKIAEFEAKLAEAQQNAPKVPENVYEHEHGYVLNPEFVSAQADAENAQIVLQHWRNQLEAVREGASEYKMLGVDQKTGQFVITGTKPADAKAEVDLMSYFNHAQSQAYNLQGSLRKIAEEHQSKYKQTSGFLQNYEDTAFKFFTTEDGKKMQPALDDIIAKFPAAVRKNPLMRMAAKSLFMNVTLTNLVNQLQAKVNSGGAAAGTLSEDQRRSGPTTGHIQPGGSGKPAEREVSFEDFKRRMED
jgi:hypothetical protein